MIIWIALKRLFCTNFYLQESNASEGTFVFFSHRDSQCSFQTCVLTHFNPSIAIKCFIRLNNKNRSKEVGCENKRMKGKSKELWCVGGENKNLLSTEHRAPPSHPNLHSCPPPHPPLLHCCNFTLGNPLWRSCPVQQGMCTASLYPLGDCRASPDVKPESARGGEQVS